MKCFCPGVMHGSHLVQGVLHLCTYIAFHVQYVLLFLADVVLALPPAVLFQTRFAIAAAVECVMTLLVCCIIVSSCCLLYALPILYTNWHLCEHMIWDDVKGLHVPCVVYAHCFVDYRVL